MDKPLQALNISSESPSRRRATSTLAPSDGAEDTVATVGQRAWTERPDPAHRTKTPTSPQPSIAPSIATKTCRPSLINRVPTECLDAWVRIGIGDEYKRGHCQMRSPRLKGVECELCDGTPLHFVLKFETLGPLGAAQVPSQLTDWKELSSIGFRWLICPSSKIRVTILLRWSFW